MFIWKIWELTLNGRQKGLLPHSVAILGVPVPGHNQPVQNKVLVVLVHTVQDFLVFSHPTKEDHPITFDWLRILLVFFCCAATLFFCTSPPRYQHTGLTEFQLKQNTHNDTTQPNLTRLKKPQPNHCNEWSVPEGLLRHHEVGARVHVFALLWVVIYLARCIAMVAQMERIDDLADVFPDGGEIFNR